MLDGKYNKKIRGLASGSSYRFSTDTETLSKALARVLDITTSKTEARTSIYRHHSLIQSVKIQHYKKLLVFVLLV